ncbi:MAG: 30S ribosomal protein S6 [Firmicutes bacterium]|nr:30S ribosomal protein S6 [Bacillota bacterium]
MNKYEMMYIIKSGTADDKREATIKKYSTLVESAGGKIEAVDKMGIRKFAYPIDFKNEGFYVLMTFMAPPSLPLEMERQMRISDEVVRFMCVNKNGQNDLKRPAPKEPKADKKEGEQPAKEGEATETKPVPAKPENSEEATKA